MIATFVALAGGLGAVEQQQRGQGGPPGVFYSNAPKVPVSVVQGDPTPTSISLSLLAPEDLEVTVAVPGASFRETRTLKANVPQTVRIEGFAGKAPKTYALAWDGGSAQGEVKLPKPAGQPFTFAIQADSHLDQNTAASVYEASLASMSKDNPDFMVDLGDTFMTGKHAKFADAISQYRAQHVWMGTVGKNAPLFLALGNHDGEQGWIERNQDGMTAWSASQRKAHFPPVGKGWATGDTEKANYFAFQWGDAQIIVLDPFNPTKVKPARGGDNWGWTLGEAQTQWLERTLAASKAAYRFVFIHHLVGGQGKDTRGGAEASVNYEWGGKNLDGTDGFAQHRPGWRMPIHDLLKKYEVDAVFRGHDHLYVKQDRDGIVYQLVPQPSHARGDSTRSAAEYGYKSGTILGSSGYLRVSVSPSEATVEYVKPGTGKVADRYIFKP